ncbi:DUF5687 family protein [Polaribacter atrinae]|uniref:Uncharacterized protein n=1 Tax=Polaribacter atrinae TaxID=1333662 RepID=A0A176TFX3_9FLAO|nr:DUF5687 family protein [Polaribacter atrinae]OAD46306.1 hypothetical protein LPB303_01870 [Polaribacter atrinae]
MISHFLKLEWKQYFRSAHWQKGIALKIIMGFLVLYFLIAFLTIGIGGYYLLKKAYPTSDPLQLVNSYLLFAVLTDLIVRYLMQTLPIMNIKPLLILPIPKNKLVHYVLGKSAFSVFNILSLFFYIPFSIVLIKEGYNIAGVLGWLATMILIIQSSNFLNFLINKNNKALLIIGAILASLIGLQKFGIFNVVSYGGAIFDFIYQNPIFAFVGVIVLAFLYQLNYKHLRHQVYLDEAVASKVEEATSADLSFTDRLGDVAPFIKNDIRLIWRNKRTKTVFLMSFLFLFYGLIFFTNKTYAEMPAMLIFASLFITGGFTLNYGQFIPAWDSAHYKMLMSQSFKYRKFLESKWVLMVTMTTVLYVLSLPYLYFGVDIFLMITAGAIFNIGFNSLFLLYAGSFNRKRINLTKGGFGNTQGTSATQFLVVLPIMGIPLLLFWGFSTLINFNAGIIAIALVGILGLTLKNYAMNFIEKKYIKDKYVMINAFGKEA